MTAKSDQQKVLRCLYNVAIGTNGPRSVVLKTIQQETVIQNSRYLRTIIDDLEINGLVNTRQAYSVSGGRFFQISAGGIDFIRSGKNLVETDSSKWTGYYSVPDNTKILIKRLLEELSGEIAKSGLSNKKISNAQAIVGACLALVEAPDTPWKSFVGLLGSSTIMTVFAWAGFADQIFENIRGN